MAHGARRTTKGRNPKIDKARIQEAKPAVLVLALIFAVKFALP
jgi:hypothetical protein